MCITCMHVWYMCVACVSVYDLHACKYMHTFYLGVEGRKGGDMTNNLPPAKQVAGIYDPVSSGCAFHIHTYIKVMIKN